MFRFGRRRLQAAPPPWLGPPCWSGRRPPCALSPPSGGSAQKAGSFLSPPSSGGSPAPPTSGDLLPSPSSGVMMRPSPSTCTSFPSPTTCPLLLERPARSRVGMPKPFPPPPASSSSTSAAVILLAPVSGLPPPSLPFGQVWMTRCFRPPPPPQPSPSCALRSPAGGSAQKAGSFLSPPSSGWSPAPPTSGDLLLSPSSGAMMPSSPSTCPSFASPSTCVPLWSPLETPKHFRPPPALRSSASAEVTLPARGAGLLLPSPPASSAYGQVWTARCLGGPPPPLSPSGGWQPYTGVTLAAPGTSVPPSRQPSPPPVVIPPGAGLSQLASLQQPRTLESAKCVQLQGNRPLCLLTRERSDNRGFMLSPPGLGLLQLRSRATRTSLFSRNFATNSGPSDKKMVEFARLSPHCAPASVGSQKVEVYRKLKEFKFGFINPDHLRATIAEDLQVTNAQFDVSYLKKLYDDKVKDILIASGIFVDPSDETYLAALDAGLVSAWGDVFDQTGPLYLTTLDVMRKLVALPPFKWRYLLDFLRDSKILVLENWTLSLGNIETMMHSHGINLPLGRTLYRGQTDASFNKDLSMASLCGITWGDTQVVDFLICPNIASKSNIEAEMMSAVMLLRRAIDLKIEDFLLNTDCSHVDGVLREEITEKANSEHGELSKLLLGLKSKFRNIFSQLEPREKLMFPDSLLRLQRGSILVFEEVLRIWSPHLLGLPVFRIHLKRRKIVTNLIAKQASGGKLILHHAYKVKVNGESSKLDGLRDVVMGMLPKKVEVLVREKGEAILVKQELKKMFRKGTLIKFQKRKTNLGDGYEVVSAMKRTSASTRERTLRVIYHSSMEDVTVQNMENTVSVKLLTSADNEDNLGALRPECFLFFNGKLDIEKKS